MTDPSTSEVIVKVCFTAWLRCEEAPLCWTYMHRCVAKDNCLTVAAVSLAEIVDVTCKMTLEDKWTYELIAENTTPCVDIEPLLKITFYTGMRFIF
jgi:hypothetical protein